MIVFPLSLCVCPKFSLVLFMYLCVCPKHLIVLFLFLCLYFCRKYLNITILSLWNCRLYSIVFLLCWCVCHRFSLVFLLCWCVCQRSCTKSNLSLSLVTIFSVSFFQFLSSNLLFATIWLKLIEKMTNFFLQLSSLGIGGLHANVTKIFVAKHVFCAKLI